MCLMLFAWHARPDYPLIFAGNRDEAYVRPSLAAAFWEDEPEIFGGRDLEKGGSWLALTRSGRLATVTNYRAGFSRSGEAPRSRGGLVASYLRSTEPPTRYLQHVIPSSAQYRDFCLIVGDLEHLYFYSNRGSGPEEIAPGVHGLSNHLLDTPWPKVRQGRERVSALLQCSENEMVAGLFEILADRTRAPDTELPDTGVGLTRERELSSCFIADQHYGTRASTVLLINSDGHVLFIERLFGPLGVAQGSTEHRFKLDAGATVNVGAAATLRERT